VVKPLTIWRMSQQTDYITFYRVFKLRTKIQRFPELDQLHRYVKEKYILDGELIALNNGVPDFYEIQRRSILTDPFKMQLAGKKSPVSFVAYDIIYHKDSLVTDLPLIERKKLLEQNVKEIDRFAISRYIENNGIALYNVAEQQKLEGVVAKEKSSKYCFDKKSKDWIKIKYLKDMDFAICGYILKDKGMSSIILGQYNEENELIYKGHVTLGVSLRKLNQYKYEKVNNPPIKDVPSGSNNEDAVWIEPTLVCTVEYMPNEKGSLRQPVLKGFREDKLTNECKE
jgi:bifunctional non-homologous end joining protein LigD